MKNSIVCLSIVIMGLLIISGCVTESSPTKSITVTTPTPETPITIATSPDYHRYTDSTYGFSILYPINWTFHRGDDNIIDPKMGVAINKTVTFFTGVSHLDTNIVSVNVGIYPKTKITIINESSIKYFLASVKTISKPDSVIVTKDEIYYLNGEPGRKLEYTFVYDIGKYGNKYRSTSYLIIGKNADFLVEYTALDSVYYERNLEIGKTMINSFALS